uniref:DUF2095 domain-containing protein n=1 Tax=Staphylothermus marinus TaxID=2280 RepID=A0A7J3PKP6_STAMA
MRMSIDEFRKKYPNLAREILDNEGLSLTIKFENKEYVLDDPWRGYIPKVDDYIRRCKTVDEAVEVIDYLEKNGEITSDEARSYREILREKGLEYFGPRKTDDYYYKKAYEYWRKRALKQDLSRDIEN